MSKFYNLSEDTIDTFKKVFSRKTFPLNVGIQFVGSESQKNLIKVSKLPDQYSFILDKELIVSINDDLMSIFDDDSIDILIEQELDKVFYDSGTGKIKMIKPDLNTFSSLINKYGIDRVSKANQVESLYQSQKDDQKIEAGFIA